MGLNDDAITQEKSLTDLMGELKALEDNAHNLADAPGAIRAKEREVIAAFGVAYDELKALFEGANVEPIANAVKAQVTEQFAGEIAKINEHIAGVVAQAREQLDASKVDIAAAVSEFQAKLEAAQTSITSHFTAIEDLQNKVVAISEHPALSIPAIDEPAAPAAGAPAAEGETAAAGN